MLLPDGGVEQDPEELLASILAAGAQAIDLGGPHSRVRVALLDRRKRSVDYPDAR